VTVYEWLDRAHTAPGAKFIVLRSGVVADGFRHKVAKVDVEKIYPVYAWDVHAGDWTEVSGMDEVLELIDRPWCWRGIVEPPAPRVVRDG